MRRRVIAGVTVAVALLGVLATALALGSGTSNETETASPSIAVAPSGAGGGSPGYGAAAEPAVPDIAGPDIAVPEPAPGGTILHQRLAAPKTSKERAIMEQIVPSIAEAVRTSTTHLIELLDEELERRGRDAIEEPPLPRPRPDGPAGPGRVSSR